MNALITTYPQDFVVGVCEDFTQYWGACGRIDPVRQTPSAISQFYYCLKRSLRQVVFLYADHVSIHYNFLTELLRYV